MGLFDSFDGSTGREQQQQLSDKSETIRRLTLDLVEMREKYDRLEESNRVAIGARTAAVEKIRDLQDVLRLKEGIFDDFERQLDRSRARADKLEAELASANSQLQAIRAEREDFPLSDLDLLHRHQTQIEVFEAIQEALTCPVCYETYSRNSCVSLLCGHSFCEPCFSSWERKHLDAFKMSSQQGPYKGADCPECRSTDVRRGRVRIWAMEEIVRLVERGIRESKKLYTPPPLPPTATPSSPPPSPPAIEVSSVELLLAETSAPSIGESVDPSTIELSPTPSPTNVNFEEVVNDSENIRAQSVEIEMADTSSNLPHPGPSVAEDTQLETELEITGDEPMDEDAARSSASFVRE